MTIQTETSQAGQDLNDVSAVLHKQIDRGHIGASEVIALVELVAKARGDAFAEAYHVVAHSKGIKSHGAALRDLVERIRELAPSAVKAAESEK